MKSKNFILLLAAATLLLSLAAPNVATATTQDIVVEPNPPSGSDHVATIQAAIQRATDLFNANSQLNNNFRILVNAGTYTGTITPSTRYPITIMGSPSSGTAGTFISGGGTVFNLSGVKDVHISNFTFENGATVSVTNSSPVDIRNIVFSLNGSGTAVTVTNAGSSAASSVSIINNTFFNAGVGVSTDSDIQIINNIFNRNGTAILAQRNLTQVLYNAFYSNRADGIVFDKNTNLPNAQHPGVDPMFVNPPNDFHLQSSSPAKGNGDTAYQNSFDSSSDIGAYGGPSSDLVSTMPATVTGVTSQLIPPSAIKVSWDATTDSTVTGYRVYYGPSLTTLTGSTEAAEGTSPIDVPLGTTQLTLTGFKSTPPAVPTAPQITGIMPMDRALLVNWQAVPGATSYFVYVSTSSITDASSLVPKLATTNSLQVPGLVNGTTYYIRVAAVAQKTIYMAVTAVGTGPRGEQQSALSAVTSQSLSDPQVSPLSNEVHDFPEATTAFPNLKSQGCFIATAAYGFYSAPQVQALRIFRDRYLLTNAPGRAFVAWYYRVGPRGAAYLNAHPWLKAPVRVALLPLVAVSIFLVYTPFLLKIAMALIAILGLLFLQQRREKKMQLAAGRVR